MEELERSNGYQKAELFIQSVRLTAIETGEPPNVVKVLKEMRRGFWGEPYRAPLLDYAIELLEGKTTTEIPEEALP